MTRTQELGPASLGCPLDVCTQTPSRRVSKTIVEFIRLYIFSFGPTLKDSSHFGYEILNKIHFAGTLLLHERSPSALFCPITIDSSKAQLLPLSVLGIRWASSTRGAQATRMLEPRHKIVPRTLRRGEWRYDFCSDSPLWSVDLSFFRQSTAKSINDSILE